MTRAQVAKINIHQEIPTILDVNDEEESKSTHDEGMSTPAESTEDVQSVIPVISMPSEWQDPQAMLLVGEHSLPEESKITEDTERGHFNREPGPSLPSAPAIAPVLPKAEIDAGKLRLAKQLVRITRKRSSLYSAITSFFRRTDRTIDDVSWSQEMPGNVDPSIKKRMVEHEDFLAESWVTDPESWSAEHPHRGTLTIHVDEPNQQTIFQLGVAPGGPIYVTIPKVIKPEQVAMNSVQTILKRMRPFIGTADPLAVINGRYQQINLGEFFSPKRVIRAPSGNRHRLKENLSITARRDRLSTQNTVILNSIPTTSEQYNSVFHDDRAGQYWKNWSNEAQPWNEIVTRATFTGTPEASSSAFFRALGESPNVVVIVAHCDGKTIFLPYPRPDGSTITEKNIAEHRAQIEANRPFVYLFSCESGILTNLENFASILLDNGASGVVAAQSKIRPDDARPLLARLLHEERKNPPIEDLWEAMQQVNFFEMEVFLA